MMWAASRYTEAKLDPISAELFKDIDKDTVDFVDNYDSTMKEPTLLPVTFPSVLVNNNTGIAVGMASSICSFNLEEVCRTTIELIRNPDHCVADTLKAPDFAGGAKILYDRAKIEEIYRTGRGSFKLYAKYTYDKSNNCIDITEIPMTSTATSESIIEKVIDRVKAGAIKEISDIRDETDKSGLKITIDLKRGTDPDKLMQKLYRLTPLSDSFACNFNVLIAGSPRVMGVKELLNEWIAFRMECVRRRTYFDLKKLRTSCICCADLKNTPRYRQGDKDRQKYRRGGGGRPEPHDRLRNRPHPGGVCRGDKASSFEPRIYLKAHAGYRRSRKAHCRS